MFTNPAEHNRLQLVTNVGTGHVLVKDREGALCLMHKQDVVNRRKGECTAPPVYFDLQPTSKLKLCVLDSKDCVTLNASGQLAPITASHSITVLL